MTLPWLIPHEIQAYEVVHKLFDSAKVEQPFWRLLSFINLYQQISLFLHVSAQIQRYNEN